MKPWRWIAVREDRPSEAEAAVTVRTPGGRPAGNLCIWPEQAKRPRAGARVDPRVFDPNGERALVSWVRAPRGVSLDFDDPAVVGAERRVMEHDPADLCSTLIVEQTRFAGAITAIHDGGDVGAIYGDPFAGVFLQAVLEVGPGILGRMPAPVGPGIQRYGGGNPWPWDRF